MPKHAQMDEKKLADLFDGEEDREIFTMLQAIDQRRRAATPKADLSLRLTSSTLASPPEQISHMLSPREDTLSTLTSPEPIELQTLGESKRTDPIQASQSEEEDFELVSEEPCETLYVLKTELETSDSEEIKEDKNSWVQVEAQASTLKIVIEGVSRIVPDATTSAHDKIAAYTPLEGESSLSEENYKNDAWIMPSSDVSKLWESGYENSHAPSQVRTLLETLFAAILPASFPFYAFSGWTDKSMDKIIDALTHDLTSRSTLGGIGAGASSWVINFLSNKATFPEAFPRVAAITEDFKEAPLLTSMITTLSILSAISMAGIGYVGFLPFSNAVGGGSVLAAVNAAFSGFLAGITRYNGLAGISELLKKWIKQGTYENWLERMADDPEYLGEIHKNYPAEMTEVLSLYRADKMINREIIHRLLLLTCKMQRDYPEFELIVRSKWSYAALGFDITLGLTSALAILPAYSIKFVKGLGLIEELFGEIFKFQAGAITHLDPGIKAFLGVLGSAGTDAAFFYASFLFRASLVNSARAIAEPVRAYEAKAVAETASSPKKDGCFSDKTIAWATSIWRATYTTGIGLVNAWAGYSGAGLATGTLGDPVFGPGAEKLGYLPQAGACVATAEVNGRFVLNQTIAKDAPPIKTAPLSDGSDSQQDFQSLLQKACVWMSKNDLSLTTLEALTAERAKTPCRGLPLTLTASATNLPEYGHLETVCLATPVSTPATAELTPASSWLSSDSDTEDSPRSVRGSYADIQRLLGKDLAAPLLGRTSSDSGLDTAVLSSPPSVPTTSIRRMGSASSLISPQSSTPRTPGIRLIGSGAWVPSRLLSPSPRLPAMPEETVAEVKRSSQP